MKHTIILALIAPMICLSQIKNEDSAFLLFDGNNDDKCKIEVEGKGFEYVKKYRKTYQENFDTFYICDLQFRFDRSLTKDIYSIQYLDEVEIVDTELIKRKKSETILKYNPFENIYLLEKITPNKIVRYRVQWMDQWVVQN